MNRKTRVIRFHRTEGPEVLQIDEIELPPLKNNEVLLKMDELAISRSLREHGTPRSIETH
jgi:NADPH:quinone reductase-like Zn-dependent oxidoreductase